MSTSKHFNKICIIVIILAMLGTVLFMNGEAFGLTPIIDTDSEYHSDDTWFTENDQDAGWDTSGATVITLEGEDASVSGRGAYAYDGSVYISNAGKYVLSGSLTDGSIVVDAADSSKVWILLDGVEISCLDDACIRVDQADKVFLTLAEGTENSLSSGVEYTEEALADGTGGVIFSHDDLTINGSGSLTVTAAYKHGIEANDDLVITGGTITIDAPGDGIHVNDSLRMMETTLTITAVDDGIDIDGAGTEETAAAVDSTSATTADPSQNGYLHIESGTYNITSEGDAIHTAGDITITGGTFTISSGDDGIHSEAAFDMVAGTVLIEECYEGIEAKTINIAGGDVTVYPTDDGLNANGNSGMGMGMGNMAAGMAGRKGGGMQGGENMTEMPEPPQMPDGENMTEMPEPPEIPDGENMNEMPEPPQMPDGENMTVMPEMPRADEEGAAQEVPAGNTAETEKAPTDENAGAAVEEQTATTEEAAVEEETWLCISGGSVTIINESGRDADGLDSNGDIYITGGTVRVSMTGSDGSNSAIDYGSENGGVFEVTGGTIVACGGSSMAEGFDVGSTQVGILYNLESAAQAGTDVQVLDENGEELLSYTAECAFNSVALSCPELEVGSTYTIVIGDISEEVTPDSTAVTVGTAGMGMSGFGGGMQNGNMQPGGMNNMMQNTDAGGMRKQGGMQRGGMGRMGNTESTDSTGSTESAESAENDETQNDSSENSMMTRMPEGGEMPDPPQMTEGEEMPDPMQMGEGSPQMENGTMTEAANTGLTPEEQTKNTQYIGIAAAVLAAAILFAVLYRRH